MTLFIRRNSTVLKSPPRYVAAFPVGLDCRVSLWLGQQPFHAGERGVIHALPTITGHGDWLRCRWGIFWHHHLIWCGNNHGSLGCHFVRPNSNWRTDGLNFAEKLSVEKYKFLQVGFVSEINLHGSRWSDCNRYFCTRFLYQVYSTLFLRTISWWNLHRN